MIRAYVGRDGAGKDYLIADIEHDVSTHASTLSSKIHMHKLPGVVREFLIAGERILKGAYLRILDKVTKRDVIMNRCYICGIVYARYYDSDKWVNVLKRFETKPDEIYMLAPRPGRAQPKRDMYHGDTIWFNTEYYKVLEEEGYRKVDDFGYNFGKVLIWRR